MKPIVSYTKEQLEIAKRDQIPLVTIDIDSRHIIKVRRIRHSISGPMDGEKFKAARLAALICCGVSEAEALDLVNQPE